ncbi:MAG: Dabb family protein [Armatimonadetes bacterium]|nr:Dabb family protein [Armatimonadota bacterium]
MVKHIVLLRFNSDTPLSTIEEIFSALAGLREKIPGILDFSGGPYDSPEGLNQGFNHGFIMTFDTANSRNVYLDHPEHEPVKQMILPHLEGGIGGVIAFDYNT